MQTSHRSTSLLLAAALAAALLATLVASAIAKTTVHDGKRETTALAKNGRLDIIRASEDRNGGKIAFAVTMRKRVRGSQSGERPLILLNTRGNGQSRAEYLILGSDLLRIKKKGSPVVAGDAALRSRGRTWTYSFDPTQIKGLDRFGWAAVTRKGTKARDVAPERRYAHARA